LSIFKLFLQNFSILHADLSLYVNFEFKANLCHFLIYAESDFSLYLITGCFHYENLYFTLAMDQHQ